MKADQLITRYLAEVSSQSIEKHLRRLVSKYTDVLRLRDGSFEVEGITRKDLLTVLEKLEKLTGEGFSFSSMDDSGWSWHVFIADLSGFHRL